MSAESLLREGTGVPFGQGGSMGNGPIVLIHGIKGSNLAQTYDDSFDVIWSALQSGFESIEDLKLDDAGHTDRDPRGVIQTLKIEKLAYGEVLARMRRDFPDRSVYIFRYDWRLDIRRNAERLSEFLDLVQHKNGNSSVSVVTHSMGGLILAACVKLDPARQAARLDRAVVTVPPFRGSIEAIRSLIVGDGARLGFNSSDAFRKIARTFPSVYQLVSHYQGFWEHPLGAGADVWNLDHWQHRVRFGTRPKDPYEARDTLMQAHLTRAQKLFSDDIMDLDSLPRTERDKFLILYGTGARTRTKLPVTPRNSEGDVVYFFDFDGDPCWSEEGDGTVPVQSAQRFTKVKSFEIDLKGVRSWWRPAEWDDAAKAAFAGYHAMFLGLDKIQGLVCDWLAGRNPKPAWARPINP